MGYHLTTTDDDRSSPAAPNSQPVHSKTHGGPHFKWVLSTKYADEETGLIYYGYRYYQPETGRWVSRDPIGEIGGFLLYGFCANNALSFVDSFGLWFEWTPLWGTIESYVRTQLGLYPGMKSSDYASCSDEDASICKVKIAQEEYKYWLKFSAPNVVKLGVDYAVTIISIYFRIPQVAIPATVITSIDTAVTLIVNKTASEKIKKAGAEAEKIYCGCKQ